MKEIKVLIVDDSKVVQAALKAAFRKFEGYHFRILGVASDGQEALWLYKTAKPDIVTLDIEMPRMEGPDFLKLIKKIDHQAKIIVISSVADTSRGIECLSLGASAIISKKELTPERLAAEIHSVAAQAA